MTVFRCALVLLALLPVWTGALASDPLPTVIEANQVGNKAEAEVQRQIDALSDAQRVLFEEYDDLSREQALLATHNAQLQRMVDDQNAQLRVHQQALADLADTRREILPLVLDMVDWLDELVGADRPFRVDERRRDLAELRRFLDRGDLDLGARYERVLEHYEQALSDGQRVEAYAGKLPGDEARVVEFLKVGRLALYYQTPGGQDSAYWNAAQQRWMTLGDDDRRSLARAIRIVRNEAPPGLLQLPLDLPSRAE